MCAQILYKWFLGNSVLSSGLNCDPCVIFVSNPKLYLLMLQNILPAI